MLMTINSFNFSQEVSSTTPTEVTGEAVEVNHGPVSATNEVVGISAPAAPGTGKESNHVLEQQTSYMRKVGNSWIRLPAPTGPDNVVTNAAAPEAGGAYLNLGGEEVPDEPFEDLDQLFNRFVCFNIGIYECNRGFLD